MFGKNFTLNENTLPIIAEIGRHIPGGFFIYKAEAPETLLYANQAVYDIYGCEGPDDFRELTGFAFRGMVHPEDYKEISATIIDQVQRNDGSLDHVPYRVIRKDGAVRWIDNHGRFSQNEVYGGIYYVFISDITEVRMQMDSGLATRAAVIEALSEVYHTVWLINDVKSETFSLYRGDTNGGTAHFEPIQDALGQMKYSRAKEHYIHMSVAPADRERLSEELALQTIIEKLKKRSQYTVNYLRVMPDGSERYFRIEFAKVHIPGGKLGIVCGFKDVDTDIRQGQAMQKALREAQEAEKENERLMAEVQNAAKLADLMGSVASLMSNMPAMSFSKDAETGVYLACNQPFAEYAKKKSPDEVIGLTDFDLFDPETAAHFAEDDKKALSMDEPYIFFEDVPDASGEVIRNLQTTKLKFKDASGRLCTLGMCVDVTDIARMKTSEAREQ